MLAGMEEQMAVMLWQVPQQMFVAACDAIYILLKRKMQIFAKQWALLSWEVKSVAKKQEEFNIWRSDIDYMKIRTEQ